MDLLIRMFEKESSSKYKKPAKLVEEAAAPAEKQKNKTSEEDDFQDTWNDDEAWGEFEREDDVTSEIKPAEVKKKTSSKLPPLDVKKDQQDTSIINKKEIDDFLNECEDGENF